MKGIQRQSIAAEARRRHLLQPLFSNFEYLNPLLQFSNTSSEIKKKRNMQEKKNLIRFIALVTIPLIHIIFSGCQGNQDIIIVKNSSPRGEIVVSTDATDAEKFAADELQTYLEKISDAEIPVKNGEFSPRGNHIFVGQSTSATNFGIDTEGLSKEGFVIRTLDDNLFLVGHDDAGTQFAVYTFLEKYMGVRWFWPGESGEVVPQKHTISIGEIDHIEEPDFKWRDRGPGGALWGATEGPTEMHARSLLLGITKEHQKEVRLWEKRNKWGGMKIYGGHILAERFLPERYAKSHPEYFALVDGKRTPPDENYDHKHGAQICTTNPDVLKIAVEYAINFFNDHPDYDGLNMSMNDGPGFCECESCLALDPDSSEDPAERVITDRIFTFYNHVTEELQKTHPGKYIICLAYSRYKEPPVNVEIHPNLIPQYTLWSAYSHADTSIKKQHHKMVSEWSASADELAIYEYYINGSWPGLHRLVMPFYAKSIKDLHQQGVNLYQTQSGDEFAINGLNYYVAGKLLWDTSLKTDSVLDDFYQKAFGRSGEAIRNFHQRLMDAWTDATREGEDISCNPMNNERFFKYFSPRLLEDCREDLAEATRLAENETIQSRVEFYKKGFHFTELTVHALKATDELEKELERLGMNLFPLEKALTEVQSIERKEVAKEHVKETLGAWEARNKYVEELKNDYVLAYFWVKYNDGYKGVNPTEHLKKILGS